MGFCTIAVAYANPEEARKTLRRAFADAMKEERGRWVEVKPKRARGEWRLAVMRDWPFEEWEPALQWARENLRRRLQIASIRAPLVLIAIDEHSMERYLWAIVGTNEIERSIDDRMRARRAWKDERGVSKARRTTFGPKDDRVGETEFCAIEWLKTEAGIDWASFVDAVYAADEGEDLLADVPEPEPDPLPFYIRSGLSSSKLEGRVDAVMSLQDQPPSKQLVDALVSALGDASPKMRNAGAFSASFVAESLRGNEHAKRLAEALWPQLDPPRGETAQLAADALAALDHEPARLVAHAKKAIASDDAATQALGARLLAGRPEEALDLLTNALTKGAAAVKEAAAAALAEAKTLPASLAPLLVKAARGNALEDALRALGKVRGAPDVVLSALTKALDDERGRYSAIEALAEAEVPRERVRTLLWPFLVSDHASLAATTLARTGVPTAELIAAVEATKKKDERTRERVVRALGELAKLDRAAVAAVERHLGDRATSVRLAAVQELATASELQPAARAALKRATKHADIDVRDLAKRHLAAGG